METRAEKEVETSIEFENSRKLQAVSRQRGKAHELRMGRTLYAVQRSLWKPVSPDWVCRYGL